MTQAQPIQTRPVQPAVDRDITSLRPTETRYGWCPYGDINLTNSDGTINMYVQPHEISDGEQNVPNPYHRVLPKGQMIPFPTFNVIEQMPSPDLTDGDGRAVLITGTRAMTAHDAAVSVLQRYSGWGFTIFNSLQGLDQDTAFRIFQVVQPLDYPMSQLINELSFGARERIDATEALTFDGIKDYVVQPLTDREIRAGQDGKMQTERQVALQLADEMETGAQIAFDLATETLNNTETSMTTRFAGGQGKTGPDALDRRLSSELDRDLPKMVGNGKNDQQSSLAEMKSQMDFLVGREASRADKERIAELEAKIAAMEAGGIDVNTMKEPVPPVETSSETADSDAETQAKAVCGHIKDNGEPCQITTGGGKCGHHADKE